MRDYILRDDIYVSPFNNQPFNYSDGDEPENYILDLLTHATDVTIGSEELAVGMKDWPSLYHLSPKRADLLRPLEPILHGKSILEIGSGCGAITRYLGELGCQVTALEGSLRRATITRRRCRDLDKVSVVNDNFQDFEWTEKFDVVTLIGVLEYSNLFIQADQPAEAMLEKIRGFLKPGGKLVIAIENKLGLKYLAGAPEDHVDQPFFGIENKYNSSTATTFGRTELIELLKRAGLPTQDFFYPFPDYKLPRVILTEKGMRNETFFVEELLREKLEYFQSRPYATHFSTSLAVEVFFKNKVLSDFSNSFLIVASTEEDKKPILRNILAYAYSTGRKKPFCKENIFEIDPQGKITVIRKKIYDVSHDPNHLLYQRFENETYYNGQIFNRKAITITSAKGWSVDQLAEWASAFYTILCKYAIIRDGKAFLEGQYVDLIPFNILLQDGSNVRIFDQEWVIREDLPLYYVFFRGIRYSIGDIMFVQTPAEGTPHNVLALTLAVVNKVIAFDEEMLADCLAREKRYFTPVVFGGVHTFDHGSIHIRDEYDPDKQAQKEQLLHLNQDLNELKKELDEIRLQAENEKERALRLQEDKDWYVRTYEKRSFWGLVKDRIRATLKS